MVKITKCKFTDIDGNVRKVKKIEAAHARIKHKDGTIEEYSDCKAEEWPYRLPDSPAEWQVFGIPASAFLRILNSRGADAITILASEDGETLLELVNIVATGMLSAGEQSALMGVEEPLTSETANVDP